MTFKLGDKVRVKKANQLIKMTGIKGDARPVMQESGLLFKAQMLSFAGQVGVITEIVKPGNQRKGENNQLKEPAYRVSAPETFWTADMLERAK